MDDRLSSFSDEILTNILSRTSIDTAATTSVLSRRWRHLWTGVTRFHIYIPGTWMPEYSTVIDHIFQQLTSSKLLVFDLTLLPTTPSLISHSKSFALDSIFRHVCLELNVEEFSFSDKYCFFPLPVILLHSPSLVILKLYGGLKTDMPENAVFSLPNLKELVLHHLIDVPIWLGPLIRSCPLLESLALFLRMDDACQPRSAYSVNIFAPNLNSLNIDFHNYGKKQLIELFIDAPKLANLHVVDNFNVYYFFVHDPANLVDALVKLRRSGRYQHETENSLADNEDYVHHLSNFVRGMSSATNLKVEMDSNNTYILAKFCSMNAGVRPIFHKLNRFELTFTDHIGLNVWIDLLLSLHCFPNLEHLKVDLFAHTPTGQWTWVAPDSVPNCLVARLKTIRISGITGVEVDLKLIAYILSHAASLEKLHVGAGFRYVPKEVLREEQCNFCRSLFKLPRSSTCEVLFFGPSTIGSSNTYEMEGLTYYAYPWLDLYQVSHSL